LERKAQSAEKGKTGPDAGRIYVEKFFRRYLWPVILFLLSLVCMPGTGEASRPVERRLTGCVVKGQFFSVLLDREQNPSRAYRIRMQDGLDLSPYEGKVVVAHGWLTPGDLFRMRPGTGPATGGTCPEGYRKVINKEFLIDYIVAAHKAAEKGDFKQALSLMGKAFEIDTADCQTYIDRAYIYYLRGDFASGGQDVETVKTGSCADRRRLNFLIMEDVGKILVRHGRKPEALELCHMALESCGSDICRDSVNKEIRALKGSEQPKRAEREGQR
jgi:hypothetical protein